MTGFADRAVLAAETSADHLIQKRLYTADLQAKIERVPRTTSGRFDQSFGNARVGCLPET